ncbi:MAG TPA: hypothetical protein VND87_18910 [Stellaceae bacterium]|nr:hypothetical protein [Stellaceae bacterium]
MKKGIAGSVGQFDEAESFVGVEPFYHGLDRWPGGGLLKPRCCAVAWGCAEIARLIVIVIVEAAPAPLPITSIRFQGDFPRWSERVPIARNEDNDEF